MTISEIRDATADIKLVCDIAHQALDQRDAAYRRGFWDACIGWVIVGGVYCLEYFLFG